LRLLLCSLLFVFLSSQITAQSQSPAAKGLESDIVKALGSATGCRSVTVRVSLKNTKGSDIERLAVKLDGVAVGQLVVDHMTIVCDNPVIDKKKLQKDKVLEFISYGVSKVSIFASAGSLERYLQAKAHQFNKKNVHISVKFTPPYIECTYDVPKNEIASESVALLKKFIKGDKIEGYAAFQMEAKNNGLYAYSSKVITNHFLLPNALLGIFQSKFNPFDEIVVLKPFQYTINSLTVQSKYIYMTN